MIKKYKKELLISFLFFIVLYSGLMFYFYTAYKATVQDFTKNILKENALLIDTTINTLNKECDTIFYLKINQPKVLKIMNKANNPNKRDIARKELYSLLLPTYKILKSDKLSLFFFQLPNAISFLRFHKPSLYGDSIKHVRYSIDLADKTRKIIRGFEEGIMIGEFRNVYPLFYKNKFIGTVEISYSINAISQTLINHNLSFYGLLQKKELIYKKVWKKFRNNYVQSLISNNYVWDKRVFNSNYYKDNKVKLIKDIQKIEKKLKIKKELSKNKPFIKTTSLNNKNYISIFQPIKNIKSQIIGYIVTIEENNFLTKRKHRYTNIQLLLFIGSLLVSLLLFLFLKNEKDIKRALSIQADYDPLTKLLNRRGFKIAYQTLLNIHKRTPKPFTVLFLDIDNFKKINDTYGHDIGDEVIKELADILRKNLKESDIIGRWGGEEFVVLIDNIDLKTSKEIAETIRSTIEKYHKFKLPHFTVSIGLAHTKENKYNLDTILKKADKALYSAKNIGRNKVVVSE